MELEQHNQLRGGQTFSCTQIDGCLLFSGGVPVDVLGTLIKAMPKGAVMEPEVARLGGFGIAIGPPDALERIRVELAASERRRVDLCHPRLSEPARNWLANGEVGVSAMALFHRVTGERPHGFRPHEASHQVAHPRDPDDFRRCLLLVTTVPEFTDAQGRMAEVSPEWARLVAVWPQLAALLEREIPHWRERHAGGRAPQTYEAMKAALGNG